MAQIIPFPVRKRAAAQSEESLQEARPQEALPEEAALSAEALSEEEAPRVWVPPPPMSPLRMMGCAVLAVFGAGLVLVLLVLSVSDPLEVDSREGEGDSDTLFRSSSSGGEPEDLSGPAWFSNQ